MGCLKTGSNSRVQDAWVNLDDDAQDETLCLVFKYSGDFHKEKG